MAAGRPTKYDDSVKPYFDQIKKWIKQGATEKQMQDQLGISHNAWIQYKKKYKEFNELLKVANRKPLVEELRGALIKKALGFTYEEVEQYVKEEIDPKTKKKTGKKYMHTKIIKKKALPDTTAIFGALNLYDNDYVKDKKNYELKRQELELRKEMARDSMFGDSITDNDDTDNIQTDDNFGGEN